MALFPKEIQMMSDTLVKMNKTLANFDEELLSAELYYFQPEPPAILVLEDLKSSGFQLADRHRGLDLEHSELVMKNLARFHASSIVYIENVRAF